MPTISELTTKWGFKTDQAKVERFEAALGNAKKSATAVAGVLGVVVGAAGLSATATATAGDEYAKAARSIGITAEALQELESAAAFSGLEAEGMRSILRDLNKNASDAAGGNKGLAKTLRGLGLNAKEFLALEPDKRFEVLADALAKVKNPADRSRIAMMLMGEQGAKAASLMAGGAESIEKMRVEARTLGAIIPEGLTVQSEEMNDSLDRLKIIALGVTRVFGAVFIPLITLYAGEMKEGALANAEFIRSGVREVALGIADGFRLAWSWGRAFVVAIRDVVAWAGGMNRVLLWTKVLLATFVAYQGVIALMRLWALLKAGVALYRTLGLVATLANAKMFLLPLVIAAIAVALGIVIQDFSRFFSGQKSALGELVKEYPALGDALLALTPAWDAAGKHFSEMADGARLDFERLGEFLEDVPGGVERKWGEFKMNLQRDIRELTEYIWALFDDLMGRVQGPLDEFTAAVDGVLEPLGLGGGSGGSGGGGFFGPSNGVGAVVRDLGGARAQGALSVVQQGSPTEINVTQLPGEDGGALARRIEQERERKRQAELRRLLEALKAGRAY